MKDILEMTEAERLEEAERWRRKGLAQGKKLHGLINPVEGKMQDRQPESQDEANPFADLIPKDKKSSASSQESNPFADLIPQNNAEQKGSPLESLPDQLNAQQPEQVNAPNPEKEERRKRIEKLLGVNPNRTPLNDMQDVASGLLTGGQNLASALGQAGQYIGDKAVNAITGKQVPKVDIREEMGLGQNNPVNMRDIVGSKDPNKIAEMVGQYGLMPTSKIPLGAVGSVMSKIPGVGNIINRLMSVGAKPAAYMATQDENPLRGAAEGFGGAAVAELAPGAYQMGKNAVNAFRPGAASEKLVESLGGGTSGVNAQRLAETINTAAEGKLGEALAPQKKVMEAIGSSKTTEVPVSKLPEGNIHKLLKEFGVKTNEVELSQIMEMQKHIKSYRKTGDFDKFIEDSQETLRLNSVSPSKEQKIENMMEVPVEKEVKYAPSQKDVKSYDTESKELHEKFVKNRTFENAHKLESRLNREIRDETKDLKRGGGNRDRMNSLIEQRKDVLSEMNGMLKDQPQEMQDWWKSFKNKYREDYAPYTKTPTLAEIAKGNTKGVKPSTLRAIFSYPKEYVEKILKDMPHEGKNYILYNELHDVNPKDAEEVLKRLQGLKQSKGYESVYTPEFEKSMKDISKKIRNRNIASLGVIPTFKGSKTILKRLMGA